MRIIGITINDVISDFSGKFMDIYNQTYPNNKLLDVDLYNLSQYFVNKEQAYDFIYSEAMFELFACAYETQNNLMARLNIIQDILKEFDIKLVIISEEKGKVRCAILHFLSKIFCQLDNIRFVDSIKNSYQYFDYIVTTDYNLFNNPKTIKIIKTYNKDIDCDLTINDLTHLPTLIEKL